MLDEYFETLRKIDANRKAQERAAFLLMVYCGVVTCAGFATLTFIFITEYY